MLTNSYPARVLVCAPKAPLLGPRWSSGKNGSAATVSFRLNGSRSSPPPNMSPATPLGLQLKPAHHQTGKAKRPAIASLWIAAGDRPVRKAPIEDGVKGDRQHCAFSVADPEAGQRPALLWACARPPGVSETVSWCRSRAPPAPNGSPGGHLRQPSHDESGLGKPTGQSPEGGTARTPRTAWLRVKPVQRRVGRVG